LYCIDYPKNLYKSIKGIFTFFILKLDKIYLLSNNFDYTKLISSVAGPVFAKHMDWKFDYIKNIDKHSNKIKIVDQRITEEECNFSENYIKENENDILFFRVLDPFYEHTKGTYYSNFLLNLKCYSNAFYLSSYIPIEFVKDLDDITNGKKCFFLPYPFFEDKEYNFNYVERINKILFSGFVSQSIYPYRSIFLQKRKWSLFLRRKVHQLYHPGYPDIGWKLYHSIIGDKYIEYISKYVFMFLTPSRCGLEFSKYSECALGRAIPVGIPPNSFNDEQLIPFIKIDFNNLIKSVKKIFSTLHPLNFPSHFFLSY